ncbi:bifunctional hydroxymethylpyrimidine kinase/phosphomethylpyrimidine kinase [Salana multivorans]
MTYVSDDARGAQHLELDTRAVDVLAIGSQVVHGSVGLNAALPMYTAAGLRYAALPTTILSVLPHYPSMHRVDMTGEWLGSALADLVASGALDDVRLVAVGYLPDPGHAAVVARWYSQWNAARLAAGRAAAPLVLDPTLGDVEVGFYNDPAVGPALQRDLVPVATGAVPNLFELAHLTHRPIEELRGEGLLEAARSLLEGGLDWLVVTGLRGELEGRVEQDQIGELVLVGGSVQLRRHPFVPSGAKGVGDVFTAALNARLVRGGSLVEAVDDAARLTADHLRSAQPGASDEPRQV